MTGNPKAVVVVPVAIGMLVRGRRAEFAERADRPVRVFSIVVLVPVSLGQRDNVIDYARQVGLVTGLFCLAGLTLGYVGARLLRLGRPPTPSCGAPAMSRPRPAC
ncbi:hypothetical protein [Nocardia asteroides]|uniref:hypothetical protein n=1 Tax=Nocardia asteroides TaxID=1824 RepID=UPI001E3130BD|nr:hypothetical protein [Nocardia asteroides]UGT61918.1 hypothetical protein LTT61_00760 [Nocardia asteroides]